MIKINYLDYLGKNVLAIAQREGAIYSIDAKFKEFEKETLIFEPANLKVDNVKDLSIPIIPRTALKRLTINESDLVTIALKD